MTELFKILLLTTIPLASLPAVAVAGNVEHGRIVAIEHCRRCHVIPGENNMSIGLTPSFKTMISSQREDWRYRFEVFYALRPHPSFVVIREFRTGPEYPLGIQPVTLSVRDLDHILAYVDSLASKLRKK